MDIPKVIILVKFAVLIKGDDDAQGPFHRGADHVCLEAGGIREVGRAGREGVLRHPDEAEDDASASHEIGPDGTDPGGRSENDSVVEHRTRASSRDPSPALQ